MRAGFDWSGVDRRTCADVVLEERLRRRGVEIVSHVNYTLLARLRGHPGQPRQVIGMHSIPLVLRYNQLADAPTAMKSVRQLLVRELRDLYAAERELLRTLPGTGDEAADDDLRAALNAHLRETDVQIARLEQALESIRRRRRARRFSARA